MGRKPVLKVWSKSQVDKEDWFRLARGYPHIIQWYQQQLHNRAARTLQNPEASWFKGHPSGAYFLVLLDRIGAPVAARTQEWWAQQLRLSGLIDHDAEQELCNARRLRDDCLRVPAAFKSHNLEYGTVNVGNKDYTIRLKLEKLKTGRVVLRWTQPKVGAEPAAAAESISSMRVHGPFCLPAQVKAAIQEALQAGELPLPEGFQGLDSQGIRWNIALTQLLVTVWYGQPPPHTAVPTRNPLRHARRLYVSHPFCDFADCENPRHGIWGGPCTNTLEALNHKFGIEQEEPRFNLLATQLRRDGHTVSTGIMEYFHQPTRSAASRENQPQPQPTMPVPPPDYNIQDYALEQLETLAEALRAQVCEIRPPGARALPVRKTT